MTDILQSGEIPIHENGIHVTKSIQQFWEPFQVSLDSGPSDKTFCVYDQE
jgi:hypothetical protein